MGLKFVVSEAQARSSQASQVSSQAQQAVASLQQSIQLFLSAPLSSKAYDSAKNYFMVAYTPICQSITMTAEAFESAHEKFLSEYQGTVGGMDTDEDKLQAEIDGYQNLLHALDDLIRMAKTPRPDLERRAINVYEAMQKRQEKLDKLREYSARSASFFSEYEAAQQELNNGVAQVQNCTAWNASTGTFDIKKLDMSWAKPIQSRWKSREKMKQEKLKKAEVTKANTLEKYGLTEADLVQVNDPESVVFEKYIRLAQMGVNPHTGLPITDKEKWQFQYAAHTKTVFDVLGTVGGAYAANKAFSNTSKKASGANLNKLKPNEINNMSLDELRNSIPKDWQFFENNGRVHIKDANGNFRVRIDPPDKVTNYEHMHIFDENKNPLDIKGNIVDKKSPDGHIPWTNK